MTHRGVVVGVDGSSSSLTAARWAAHEAVMRNVVLTVVCAVAPPAWDVTGLGGPVAALQTEPTERQRKAAQQVIDDAVRAIEESTEDDTRPRVDSAVVLGGAVLALVDLSQEARMVVVGRRGQSRLRGVLLGSVSTGLVHHAHCPVAVVHHEAPSVRRPWSLPVVLGVDGSPASDLATAIAFDEASFRGVELVALHSWGAGDRADWAGAADITGSDWTAHQDTADATLSERLAGWQERYPDIAVRRRLVWGEPARYLLEEAESAQLVVVGSRGRGGFTGLLLGSVSGTVLQVAPVPVIVARPG